MLSVCQSSCQIVRQLIQMDFGFAETRSDPERVKRVVTCIDASTSGVFWPEAGSSPRTPYPRSDFAPGPYPGSRSLTAAERRPRDCSRCAARNDVYQRARSSNITAHTFQRQRRGAGITPRLFRLTTPSRSRCESSRPGQVCLAEPEVQCATVYPSKQVLVSTRL